ncbi:adenylate/guanylate cyclase domain-containing protein [Lacibacterium aquatile]|uniref:Adenylate/guanylate cyclase domain-containing protein n=1 Tax=Lacibacterium aquatile TaxID=1168082 RepID=A0ABW5DPU3_9PROT
MLPTPTADQAAAPPPQRPLLPRAYARMLSFIPTFRITRLLALVFGGLTALSIITVLWMSLHELRQRTISLANERADQILARVADTVNDIIMPVDRHMRPTVERIAEHRIEPTSRRQLESFLNATLDQLPQLAGVSFVFPDGRMTRMANNDRTLVTENMAKYDQSLRDIRTDRSSEPQWLTPVWSPIGDQAVVPVRYPIYDETDRFLGAIVAVLKVSQVSNEFARLSQITGHSAFILYDRQYVLAHPYLASMMQHRSNDLPLPKVDELGDPVLAQIWTGSNKQRGPLSPIALSGDGTAQSLTVDGADYLFLYRDVQMAGGQIWTLGTYIPGTPVDQEISQMRMMGVAGLIILLVSVGLALLLGKLIGGPIMKFAAAAETVRKGRLGGLPPIKRSHILEFDQAGKAFNHMVKGLQERERIRDLFGRYVPHEVVESLIHEPSRLILGGERREISLLFTDISGFTALSEAYPPERIIPLLNSYFEEVCRIIAENGGIVVDFIGDAVFAIFGAPETLPNHAKAALDTARAIDSFALAYAEQARRDGMPMGYTRIGVHTGVATVGNFGSQERMKYGAAGDVVNTASRLEGANKYLGTRIIVSGATAAAVDDVNLRPIGHLALLGRAEPVEAWELVDDVANDNWINRYRNAYSGASTLTETALQELRQLASERPEDNALRMILERLDQGEYPPVLSLTGK